MMRTHEISETQPGVFYTTLQPCSVDVLPLVLASEPDSHVWVVDHRPQAGHQWSEMAVPVSPDATCDQLRVRGVQYDLQLPAGEFLRRVVPRLRRSEGIVLLALDRPVPDTLFYHDVSKLPNKHAILRQNGWRLTFVLRHGGEYAELYMSDRAQLEHLLKSPPFLIGKEKGDLP